MEKTAGVFEIRNAFPALRRQVGEYVAAYFDGPGGTQIPRAVSDAMVDYLHNHNANTHWEYPSSRETDQIITESRRKVATFLNADPSGVVFSANMTTLTFHLARALVKRFNERTWIVVTDLDHQANVAPWVHGARERGIQVARVRMTPDGQLNQGDLSDFVKPGASLLAVGAASNALGTMNDLPRLVEMAAKAGSLTFVDAVHSAPHALTDFKHLGCDFLACSPYKFYGPHAGVLAARPELIDELDVARLDPAPNQAPERLETGTLSHEAIAGTAASIHFLAGCSKGETLRDQLATTFNSLHARGQDLLEEMWIGLESIPGVTLFGPPPDRHRTPTLAFTLDGVPSSVVASTLSARYGVFVSHGDFYASRVTETLGLGEEGLVRAGCACYTTREEVERLVSGVSEIAHESRSKSR
ncbi:MAG TPA: cysteine desulfurase-like protein [Rhodothermales bacterium]|nr:cysteine desulfurase-like protein [Rhodothermales bacterium]